MVWDAQSGGELLNLRGHTDLVYGIQWSPDGRRIASSSFDRSIKIWDAGTGHEVLTLHGHDDRVWSVAWSPDGRRLASASDDGTVRIWGAPGPEAESIATNHDALVRAWHHRQALASPTEAGALFHLRRLLASDPDERSAATELGAAWAARSRLQPAVELFRELVRLEPNSALAHQHLGDELKPRRQARRTRARVYKEAAPPPTQLWRRGTTVTTSASWVDSLLHRGQPKLSGLPPFPAARGPVS